MGRSVSGIILAVSAVLFTPFLSYAAGLGPLTVRSPLGHPLEAEIEILSFRPGEENSFQVRLASKEDYLNAGVDFNPALAGARVSLERRAGKSVIRVVTSQPVNDPFLTVLVEMRWPNGRLSREYTVLVDPVGYDPVAIAARQARESARAQTPAVAPEPASVAATTAAAAPAPAAEQSASPAPVAAPAARASAAVAPQPAPERASAVAPVPASAVQAIASPQAVASPIAVAPPPADTRPAAEPVAPPPAAVQAPAAAETLAPLPIETRPAPAPVALAPAAPQAPARVETLAPLPIETRPAPAPVAPAAPQAPAAADTRTIVMAPVPTNTALPAVTTPAPRQAQQVVGATPSQVPAPAPAVAAGRAPVPAQAIAAARAPVPAPTVVEPAPAKHRDPAPASNLRAPEPAPAVALAAAPLPDPVPSAVSPVAPKLASVARSTPEKSEIVTSARVASPAPPMAAPERKHAPAAEPATRAPAAVQTQDRAAMRSQAAVSPAIQPVAEPKAALVSAAASTLAAAGEDHETYVIRKGDTLGAIARKHKPDGLTYNQMLMALFRRNPEVFIRENINLIRAGARMVIPVRSEVAAVDAEVAYRDVLAHMEEFANYRRQLSASTATKKQASAQREEISRREPVRKSARTM